MRVVKKSYFEYIVDLFICQRCKHWKNHTHFKFGPRYLDGRYKKRNWCEECIKSFDFGKEYGVE
jgi:hypothetical protein